VFGSQKPGGPVANAFDLRLKNIANTHVVRLGDQLLALWEAAEADSATGRPDFLRALYPIMATITADGWASVPDAELETVFRGIEEEVRTR